MADNKMSMPSGMGGLMRYDAEYQSRFMISPSVVVGFIIAVLAFVLFIKVLLPVQ